MRWRYVFKFGTLRIRVLGVATAGNVSKAHLLFQKDFLTVSKKSLYSVSLKTNTNIMINFDLQIIWSAHTPFIIPGFLALHVQIEAKRCVLDVEDVVDKCFRDLPPDEKIVVSFVHLN